MFLPKEIPERIRKKIQVDKKTGCWLWSGGKCQGYGVAKIGGVARGVHRIIYEAICGKIEEGKQIDHLCRVRNCCNPKHLEEVTQQENFNRGNGTLHQLQKTECPNGHPYSGENLYIDPTGRRHCRSCHREREARRRSINKTGRNKT